MRVANLLVNWRFLEKLNQRDAAKLIGISSSSLCRLEKGVVPDGATLVKLINWLFAEEPNAKAEAPTTNAGDQRSDAPPVEAEAS